MNSTSTVDFSDTSIAFSSKSTGELRMMDWVYTFMQYPVLVKLGSKFALLSMKYRIPFAEGLIRKTLFRLFCGGRNLAECQPYIDELYEKKIATILDFGAEAKHSRSDFDRTLTQQMLSLNFANLNRSVPMVSTKLTGLSRFDLLAKKQAGHALSKSEVAEFEALRRRLHTLCKYAHDHQVGVMIDAEETWIQDVIDELVMELMQQFNRKRVVVYATFQLYRKDKLSGLRKAHQLALEEGWLLGAKIVRGAYMDKERERAERMNYPSPIHHTKADTDEAFNEGLTYCVENHETIGLCNASHNIDSCQLMARLVEEQNLSNDHPHVNFCQLYGMSDFISYNLANAGYNVAKYMPYGPVRDVVPYLVRRAQENTSVTGEMGRELRLVRQELKRRRGRK